MALVAGAIAYIAKLRNEVETHQNTIAQLQQEAQTKEFQDQIRKVETSVKETTRDFSSAADDFIKQYGDGTKPNTSTGSSAVTDSNKLPPKA